MASCARVGCPGPSTTRVVLDPMRGELLLDARVHEYGASALLCDVHAARVVAPRGWRRRDLRPQVIDLAAHRATAPASTDAPDVEAPTAASSGDHTAPVVHAEPTHEPADSADGVRVDRRAHAARTNTKVPAGGMFAKALANTEQRTTDRVHPVFQAS